MLFYYCAREDELPRIRREGLSHPEGLSLWTTLEAARQACAGRVLVVDPIALGREWPEGEQQVRLSRVPPSAICNLDPYRPPAPVTAAGGYVVRRTAKGLELLLIFRRGVWDLPKGKQDEGETVKACALREVQEEIGVEHLRLLQSLGSTVHGYPDGDVYSVKTTHWFLMQTPETDFTPQVKEGIERVAWVPWPEAQEHLGYETLRRHMKQITPLVLDKTL